MSKLTYATPLLIFSVIGLAATCFIASGAGSLAAANAAQEPASPLERAASSVSPAAAPSPAAGPPTLAVPAPAPVNPAVDGSARLAACQAELTKIVAENPVDFMRDRIALTARGKAAVGEVALVARACPAMNIEIQAHTDKTGKRQNNLRLSRKRADAVKQYLVELGLSPDVLTAVGFGPDRPIASNRTEAGRAQNRRIEFRVSPGE